MIYILSVLLTIAFYIWLLTVIFRDIAGLRRNKVIEAYERNRSS